MEKPKRRDIHPETGLIFWGILKGKESWVTQEVFDKRRNWINEYHRKRYPKSEKSAEKSKHRVGDIDSSTGLLFWRFRCGKEYWVDQETFDKRTKMRLAVAAKHYEKCKDKRRACSKARREKNIERERARTREYMRKFRESNREEYNKRSTERNVKRTRERKKTDDLFAMKMRIVSATSHAFRRKYWDKGSKTASLLGCDWETLKNHIEGQFKDGISWDNKNMWHIDHIIPLASAKNADELSKLCHYTNLQPMWAIDNIKKGAKIL